MFLWQLPEDAVALLASYVGTGLLRLLQCGCPTLSAKILGATREMRCEVRRFTPFPFVAYSLPHLRSLTVETAENHAFHPLRTRNRPIVPHETKESLAKIVFNFAQSLSFLHPTSDTFDLSAHLPNLRVLHLLGATKNFTREHVQALPRNLTEFHVEVILRLYCVLDVADLAEFPRTLEDLSLGLYLRSSSRRYDQLPLPQGLIHLQVRHLDQAYLIPLLLIPSLTKIHLKGYSSYEDIKIPISTLPKGLTSLRIDDDGYTSSHKAIVIIDEPLPPSLIYLNCKLEPSPTVAGAAELLSYSNLRFHNPPLLSPFADLELLPKHLTTLHLSDFFGNPTYDILPRTITELDFDNQLSLCRPEAKKDRDRPWTTLPPRITSFSGHIVQFSNVCHLPLVSLRLKNAPMITANENHVALLPGTLTHLELDYSSFSMPECLKLLPKSLISLNLLAKTHDYVYEPADILRHLPTHLLTLNLDIGTTLAWPLWLQSIDRLTSLKTLEIEAESEGWPLPDPMEVKWLSRLPRSLTRLVTLASSSWIAHPEFLSTLPPNLEHLHVSNPSRKRPLAWQDQHWANLPDSLICIYLPVSYNYTSLLLSLLPPYFERLLLDYVAVSADDFRHGAEFRSQRRDPIWENHAPP